MNNSTAVAVLLFVIVSFGVIVPKARADNLFIQIAWGTLENMGTDQLPSPWNTVLGGAITVLEVYNSVVGVAGDTGSVSLTGGGSYDPGQQVPVQASIGTGDTTTDSPGPFNVEFTLHLISPDGQESQLLQTIQITGLPGAIGTQLNLVYQFSSGDYEIYVQLTGPNANFQDSAAIQINGSPGQQNTMNSESPSFAAGSYVSPTSVAVGGTITAYYNIVNPNSFSIQVGLGMSIQQSGTGNAISDPRNDVIITVSPGTNVYTRSFSVPSYVTPGTYDWTLAIWSGSPGSSNQYDTTSQSQGLMITSS